MRRLLAVAAVLGLLLAGCVRPEPRQFTATFLDLFDTVTTIVGKAQSQEEFTAVAQEIHDELLEYHRLFDIYTQYPGINNLKTVNDAAGVAPVAVAPELLELLTDCKEFYALTGGRTHAAMGAVLELWHTARESGVNDPAHAALPDAGALAAAAGHCQWEQVILDAENGTVYLADGAMALDVGAVAKGWAVEQVAQRAPEGLLISVGGNVRATGPKGEEVPWVVGIQDPEGGQEYLHTLYLSRGSVVTSGDYQRVYWVDGVAYHHIIDPETGYPGRLWRSVTVVCQDSGLADALSTALFLMELEDGLALLEGLQAQAMWVDARGERFYSPGFDRWIRT